MATDDLIEMNSIVQQVQHEFQNLLTYVTGPDARSQTAYTVELTAVPAAAGPGRRRCCGCSLSRAPRCVRRSRSSPPTGRTCPITISARRPTIRSLAKCALRGHSFTAPGQEGLCPLDAELSLPARCYSDLLREWAVYGTTDESYRESQTVLERILGLSLSVQALETCVTDAGEDVTALL